MQVSVQLINSLLHADEHIKSSTLQFNKQSSNIDSHSSHCFDPLDGYSLQLDLHLVIHERFVFFHMCKPNISVPQLSSHQKNTSSLIFLK